MSIEKEYYLSCNKCGAIYPVKSDDAQGIEDEAIDDGWVAIQDNTNSISENHFCVDCKDT